MVVLRQENTRFLEVPRDGLIDRLLRRIPDRPAELAAPPPGSGLKPVPGERGLPWLGQALQSLRYGPAYEHEKFHQFGPVAWVQLFGVPMVHIAGPDAVQAVDVN